MMNSGPFPESGATAGTEAAPVWYVYLLRAADGSLYTGISTDVMRRFREHCEAGDGTKRGRGAKSLRGKHPLSLVYKKAVGERSAALKLEYRIKRLSKADKEALVQERLSLEGLLQRQDR